MFGIWFLCRKLLQDKNPKMVYYMLRWVVMMFILPITYVGIMLNYETGYVQQVETLAKMLFVVDMNSVFLQGMAIIWAIATTLICFYFGKNEYGKYRICKNNFEDGDSLAQTEFERIKAELGIKGSVSLYRNDSPKLRSPFVAGLWKRKVVIPYFEYSKEELDVILYHELNHIKKSDIVFRYLTMVATVINSINPIAYMLWERILLWSEADCDARAIDGLEKEGISKRQYYDVIWSLAEAGPERPTMFYYPMLLSAVDSLYRRMEIMEKYRKNLKKAAKTVTTAWVAAFVLFSSVTAHAAGVGIAKASDEMLKESQIIGQYGDFEEFSGWSDEMLVPASDVVDIVYINDEIMTLGQGTIDWDVPAGTRYVTASLYMTEGTEVQIVCSALPSDCTYWFGLMYASSECAVVEGSGAGAHTFTVPSNGYYRIMVENRSSQEISVTGGYSY